MKCSRNYFEDEALALASVLSVVLLTLRCDSWDVIFFFSSSPLSYVKVNLSSKELLWSYGSLLYAISPLEAYSIFPFWRSLALLLLNWIFEDFRKHYWRYSVTKCQPKRFWARSWPGLSHNKLGKGSTDFFEESDEENFSQREPNQLSNPKCKNKALRDKRKQSRR